MSKSRESCPHGRAHEVEYRVLTDSLTELRDRVARVESALVRGVMLLVANLAGVFLSLAHGYFEG